jgi:hypothetical protein
LNPSAEDRGHRERNDGRDNRDQRNHTKNALTEVHSGG